jgi:hypothetical protein
MEMAPHSWRQQKLTGIQERTVTDKEVIQDAYETKLGKLYEVLFASYTAAGGAPAEQSKAEAAFKAGVQQARQVRDRAISLL